jgi:hypothetical protein
MIVLPKGVTPAGLRKRASGAIDKDSNWRTLLEDCYDYFLPQRENFSQIAPGQKKMDQIFDSTAVMGTQDFASRMQEQITPLWRKWAEFVLSRDMEIALEQDPEVDIWEVKEKLRNIADVCFDYINHSNFGSQINEAYLDICIGTAVLTVEESEDPNVLLEFGTIPQFKIGFEEGPTGIIENIFREIDVRNRNIERKWPGAELPEELREKIKQNPDGMTSFLECMILENKEYWRVVLPKASDHAIWSSNDGEYGAWVVSRWAKMPNEIRGRGPATMLLPDVRSLNKIKEFALRKGAIDLAGIWTAIDDGVTNPYTIRIQPGIVIPVGTNDRTSPSLQRLDTTNDLQLTQFNVEQLQLNIRKGLYNDLRDPVGPVRSATEVAIEQRELANRIGSAFGRMQTEMLEPILRRVANILSRNGKIPQMNLSGRDVTIKFTSPLAQAQHQEELLAAQQAIDFVTMTAGQDLVPLLYDVNKFGEFAASKTGMDPTLVRGQEEILQGQQALMAQHEQQQAIDAGINPVGGAQPGA